MYYFSQEIYFSALVSKARAQILKYQYRIAMKFFDLSYQSKFSILARELFLPAQISSVPSSYRLRNQKVGSLIFVYSIFRIRRKMINGAIITKSTLFHK
jgi:hypothetical protein